MEGQIIAKERSVSALLLQYQLFFFCILRRQDNHLRKKRENDFGCENYLTLSRL